MESRIAYIQPKWLDAKQTAAMLGYSLSKVKTLIKSGELKSVKDGGHRRILPKWIDEYIAKKTADIDELELVA